MSGALAERMKAFSFGSSSTSSAKLILHPDKRKSLSAAKAGALFFKMIMKAGFS